MKYILPTVAGCASVALVGTLAVTATDAFAATVEPEVTQEALNVSEDGLDVPGARDSSSAEASVSNQSATNLPDIFKSQSALAAAQVPETVNVSAQPVAATVAPTSAGLTSPEGSQTPAPAEGTAPAESGDAGDGGEAAQEPTEGSTPTDDAQDDEDISGTVRQKTEDGVNIALISDVLDVPTKNPSLVGVTFADAPSTIRIQVRVKSDSGWGSWQDLDEDKQEEAKNEGSEPFTVNEASGVQLRILGDKAPTDAELVLVDPKFSEADAQAVADNAPVQIDPAASTDESGSTAPAVDETGTTDTGATDATTVSATGAATVTTQNYVPGDAQVNTVAKSAKVPKPDIASRKSWGAKSYKGSPSYASSIKQAVVHHTSGSNSYSAEDVPGIIRGIQTFHQQGRGWSDIGYNVVADKYGRLWQARDGDISKAVVGAHTSGHNTGTFGISVLGTYNSSAPPKVTRDAVASAIAWKFSMYGLTASKSTLVGHRDLGSTDCPGDAFYAKLGEVRDTVNNILKSGDLPSDSGDDDKTETPKPAPQTAIEKYAADNNLGKATGSEYDVKGVDGAKARNYEKGVVYWSQKTGAYHVTGAIASAYKGEAITQLGLPVSTEKGGLKGGGVYQTFSKGSFHWSPQTGAAYTTGSLLKYWKDKGYERGHLGYPKSNPVIKDGRAEQLFEGAKLVWAEGYGTTEFSARGSISGTAVDENAPGDSPPPGDSAADGGSGADSGEGAAADGNANGNDNGSDNGGSTDEPTQEPTPSDPPKEEPKPTEPPKEEPKPTEPPKEDKPSKEEQIQAQRDKVIEQAKKYVGTKYVWGGTTPNGWDCSGYTQYVYGKAGIDLPRTTSQQRNAGKEISIKDAKPGDLIWIPGHIGIISETKGQMYDAGSTRTNTTKRSYEWMLSRGAKVIRVIG
ncbi:hypothetical protein GCM10009700_21910 [Brevibacterium sanguinis]|uniref:NlpC/P60 family protein n=1 Tax=Brevibacterium sanguinis TaxID=232444 RepID=UPI0031DB0CB5